MKNLFPKEPINEVLNVLENKILIFTPLSKEECDSFTFELRRYLSVPKNSKQRAIYDEEISKVTLLNFKDIVAIGSTKIENRLANTYIESSTLTINEVVKRNFKCFVNKDWKKKPKMNLPYHEDGGSSWNCLMGKLGHPEYGIIYTIPITLKNKFKLATYD